MGVQDLVSVAFGTQAGDGGAPLAAPPHDGSTQHSERRQPSENDSYPCPKPEDTACACSVAIYSLHRSEPGCSLYLSPTSPTGTGDPITPSAPPVASTTLPFTSSLDTQRTSTDSRTLTSLPSRTTTDTTSTSKGTSPPFPASSTSRGSNGSNADTSESSNSQSNSTLAAPGSSASRSTSSVAASDSSASRSSALSPAATISPLPYSPLSGGPSSASPTRMPSDSHRLNIGTIIGIALGAFAVVICITLPLFFLLRLRARRRSKRMSVDSSRRRLKPYSYDDAPSRPISAVWTWLGRSASLDPDFEPRPGPSPHSLDFQSASEKDAPATTQRSSQAYTLSPCPSPALAETEPLARGRASPLVPLAPSAHEDPSHHRTVPSPAPTGALSSTDLLAVALARTDYAVANPQAMDHNDSDGAVRRRASGVSHTTAASCDVQSVEAL